MRLFENKVALVTGAGAGIGQASAQAFALGGAKVVIVDINENGEATRDVINQNGEESIFIKADVSCFAVHQHILNETLKKFGRLDYAHNNAGIDQDPTPFTDADETAWNKIMDVNVKGVWLGMKVQIPQMIAQGGGAIVNTASIAGLKAFVNKEIYSASKGALISLTRSSAGAYIKNGIRINCIAPGYTLTDMSTRALENASLEAKMLLDMIPIGRGADPLEIANVATWLCSEQASYVTGQCIVVDGGWLNM